MRLFNKGKKKDKDTNDVNIKTEKAITEAKKDSFFDRFRKKKESNKVDQSILDSSIEIIEDEKHPDDTSASEDSGLASNENIDLIESIKDIAAEDDYTSEDTIEDLISGIVSDDDSLDNSINDEISDSRDIDSGDMTVKEFLDGFSTEQHEEIFLSNDPFDIKEDIVLDVEEKKSYWKLYLSVISTVLGCTVAFFIAYFVSQYNIVTEPVNGAVAIFKDKYSVVYKYPIVNRVDVAVNDQILYKEESKNRFIGVYSKAIAKEIRERTVRAYDVRSKKYINVPYEKIWYVIPSDKAILNEDEKKEMEKYNKKYGIDKDSEDSVNKEDNEG